MVVQARQTTGARPILNTTQGGSQAAPGVFGSKENVEYCTVIMMVEEINFMLFGLQAT